MIQKNKRIAIVILNYNGLNLLKKFLPSVVNFSDEKISSIYLIDNCSTDNSISYVKNTFSKIKIICHKKNLGYSSGYNKGLKLIKSDYYILLNSDVEVSKGWLGPLFDLMESDKNIAACQPKILSYKNKMKFEYAGASGGFVDMLGYPFCRGRIFETIEEDRGQYDNKTQVFWASGCCLMIRSEIFHNCKGFDNSFFAHMEEIDLCWRMNNLGYKIYCESKSKIYHQGNQTLDKKNPNKTFLNFRNNLTMMLKNDTIINLLWKIPLRMLFDFIALFKFIIDKQSINHGISILKAYFYFILNFRSNISKRYKVDQKSFGLSKIIIPIKYYVFNKKKYSDL